MKIDYDYMKGLLSAFQDSEEPTLTLSDLQKAGFDYDKDENNFVFHMQLLFDENLIDRESGHGEEGGIERFGFIATTTGYVCTIYPLRLTMAGHEFAAHIQNDKIWSKITEEIKKQGFSTVCNVAKGLAIAYAKGVVGL